MRRVAWILAFGMGLANVAAGADDRDPVARARLLYNEGQWDAAVAAADQARTMAARADSGDLIAARAYLERFREGAAAEDLVSARERLRRIHPDRFGPRERIEFIVGLGETLYLEGSYGAAADVFDPLLTQTGALVGAERERVIDWWATALDQYARPRSEFDRQAVYQHVRDRMRDEIGLTPASAVAAYWLAAAARGQGDLQGAWDAAEAGWTRAPLAGERGVTLRADLDRLVLGALVPERARALGQPADSVRMEWERFKERWSAAPPTRDAP